jgi:hypothetical protein
MPLYFTSDDDIGHAAPRTFYRGSFASFAEIDRVVNRWNAVVEPGDQVGTWVISPFANQQSA